jgi:hypothetical protein
LDNERKFDPAISSDYILKKFHSTQNK